jgi:arylsulfatase A-like enzyme
MIKTIRFIVLAASVFLTASPAPGNLDNDTKTLGEVFKGLEISIEGVRDFSIKKNILRQGKTNTFWTVIANKNERVVKIEVIKNIDNKSARNYIGERTDLIVSLYKRIPSPYPGAVSKTIECPDKYIPDVFPLEIEGENIPVYTLYSTPRFTYGACADELIKYRGFMTFVYNEKRAILYRIEIFIPKHAFDKKEVSGLLASLRFNQQAETDSKKPVITGRHITAGKEKPAQTGWSDFKDYNVIIIGFEPLGAKHIGSYGYSRNTMPNLETFSRKAFFFKNAVSPSSWTLPAFMSWFTSLYPSQHKLTNKYRVFTEEEKVLSNLTELSPYVTTLAQILKKNGYATAGFTGDAGVGSSFGYNSGFDIYYDDITFGGFDIVLPKALEWIKKHKQEKFFLFIQGYDVHGRHKPAGKSKGMFRNADYRGKYKGTAEEYWELRNLNLDRKILDMTDEDVEFWRSWYDSKIYEADRRFGEFIKDIEKLNVADKTIIVVSSGSGNEFYEHKGFDHGYSLYDELIHVPLIIHVPGKKGRIEDQVRTIDIMPTVLELLNINYDKSVEDQMQGTSLVSLMAGEKLRLNAFSETDYLLQTYKRSLRTPDGWKFIYTMDTEQRELYNLNEDPEEQSNLVDLERKIADELEQELFNWLNSVGQDKYYYRRIMQDMLEPE